MVNVLPLPEGTDRELLFRLFQAREAAASTGIGDGIAIPHVRNPIVLNVDQPIVSLCFLKQAVDFGALDGRPVQVLFSLICPTIRDHLQMLARLSYVLHDSRFKNARHASRKARGNPGGSSPHRRSADRAERQTGESRVIAWMLC